MASNTVAASGGDHPFQRNDGIEHHFLHHVAFALMMKNLGIILWCKI